MSLAGGKLRHRLEIACSSARNAAHAFTALPPVPPTTNITTLTLANPFPASLSKLSGTTTAGFQVNAPTPYVQSWNFTVERDLGGGFAVEVAYAGSEGTHLSKKYDINQEIHARGEAAYVRPYAYFGEIDYYSFNSTAAYDAGIVTVRRRFAKGLFGRVNYSFSKSLDNASGENYAGAGGYEGAQNSLDLQAERGRSDFDTNKYFSGDVIYQLPGHLWLVRGWQIAATAQIHSGLPFTPQESTPTQDLGEGTRPNRLANGALSDPTVK